MEIVFPPIGLIVLAVIAVSGVAIHLRGQRRFSVGRQLFDHSTFMAPVNILMYLFSKVPTTPYLDPVTIPELSSITENWKLIREEALNLEENQTIKASDKYDDIGFNSFFRRGWKRFYLKWYSKSFHQSALDKCPRTIELIKNVPSIRAAMFVILPSGSYLPEHRDPYAGSLRYHLGLVTPNSAECFIDVDGSRYHWKDGEAVLFDETYLHHAENNSGSDRLIFFCDVRRPMKNFIGRWLNNFFSWFIVAAAKSPNTNVDKTGNINKIFKYLYQFRLAGKRLKVRNKTVYYLVKYALFAMVIYLIFF